MLLKRVLVTAATVAAVFTATGGATAAPVPDFDNGGFEFPTAPANSYLIVPAGSSLGPWQVTAGAVDLVDDGFWQAAEGQQSVDLNTRGDGPGTVAQTFTTIPGDPYTVTYSLAGNPDGPPAVKTGQALVDGEAVQDFSFDITGKSRTDMGYETRKFAFVAKNPTTTLSFASTTSSLRFGPVIDNVQVNTCGC
ncbi:choice-of-anchor C family protein [Streptomyces sp. NPDC051041]|uniref:choice-of-anchor C family protein n=1 Tax=Streptomyces sp. NPDC051041 TaxID=3365640 RepID=UPI0037A00756